MPNNEPTKAELESNFRNAHLALVSAREKLKEAELEYERALDELYDFTGKESYAK